MSTPNKFDINPISSLSANVQKLFNKSEAKDGWNSAEHDQKLTMPG